MRIINNGRVGKAIFAFTLMFGIGLMMSLTTQAQNRNDDWQRRERDRRIWEEQNRARRDGRYDPNTVYGNNGGNNNNNRNARNQGYQFGLQTGASDAQRGQSYNPQRSHYYRDASSQPFRNGFVQGYNAGFRQYAGNRNGTYNNGGYRNDGTYNNGGYRNDGYNNGNQAALNQGYQQGINTGASDAQRRQSYSPERSKHYQNASSPAFRDGFVRGYDAGYRQYAGNNGGYDNNGGYRTGNTGVGIGEILGAILGRP